MNRKGTEDTQREQRNENLAFFAKISANSAVK